MLLTKKITLIENSKTQKIFSVICTNNKDSEVISTRIRVTSFEDGVVEVKAFVGQSLEMLASVISGCFNEDSPAFEILKKAYGKQNENINAIHIIINDIFVVVNRATSDPKRIRERWERNRYMLRGHFE